MVYWCDMDQSLRQLATAVVLAAVATLAAYVPSSADALLRTLGLDDRTMAKSDPMCMPESAETDILFVSCGGFF